MDARWSGHAPVDMPGCATDDQLRELSLADGLAQGRMWIELMRAHHVGGVAMAEAALSLASTDKVLRLARTQRDVQTFEISQYDLLLAGTYASGAAMLAADIDEMDHEH